MLKTVNLVLKIGNKSLGEKTVEIPYESESEFSAELGREIFKFKVEKFDKDYSLIVQDLVGRDSIKLSIIKNFKQENEDVLMTEIVQNKTLYKKFKKESWKYKYNQKLLAEKMDEIKVDYIMDWRDKHIEVKYEIE